MGRRTIAKAERARDTARAAVTDAEQLGALLPERRRTKLEAATARLAAVAAVSDARIAAHPKRRRRELEEETARLEKRTAKARRRLRRDAAHGGAALDAETLTAAQASLTPADGLEGLTLFELRRRAREAGHDDIADLSHAQLVALLTPAGG